MTEFDTIRQHTLQKHMLRKTREVVCLPDVRGVFEKTVNRYMSDEHFSSSKEDTLGQAATFLKEANLDPTRWSFSKKAMFLSYVDASLYHGVDAYPLDSLLKEIGVNLSQKNTLFSSILDRRKENVQHLESQSTKVEAEDFIDLYESNVLRNEFFENWKSSSPLHQVRHKFGITPTNESHYTVYVSSLNSEEFKDFFHCVAFASGGTIYLPSNSPENINVHEYIHTQWRGLMSGQNYGLYRGIDEAFVEMHTPEPYGYEPQRYIFDMYAKTIPSFSELVFDAGENEKGKDTLSLQVLQAYGLRGIEVLSRYSPIEDGSFGPFYSQEQRDVFLPTDKAISKLYYL